MPLWGTASGPPAAEGEAARAPPGSSGGGAGGVKVIRSLLPTRRRLRLDPPAKLYFPYEPGKQVRSAVRIKNISKSHVAFKFQTTAPKSCFMRPPGGILAPGESIIATVFTLTPPNNGSEPPPAHHQPPKMPAMLAAQFTGIPLSQSPAPQPSFRLGLRPWPAVRARSLAPRAAASTTAVSAKPAAAVVPPVADRTVVRIGLPSKGRMAEQTLNLLKSCQLLVRQLNPRQYTADIPLIPNLEVWFQRPKDIVRKLQSGDLDLGIVGFDIVSEYGKGNEDLVVVHDALEFGHCRLSLAVPKEGIFENINTLEDLLNMPEWTEERPLRVVTGFGYLGDKFLREKGFKHVRFLSADGALESYPPMGMADAIVDLVSSGTTLRENNLKEVEGGVVVESQATLVASRKSLHKRKGVLEITHELLERLEAHLRATAELMVTANMRGNSAEEVAERVLSQTSICGLQGPTISPVYCRRDGKVDVEYYAINVVVPQKLLYKSIQQLRSIGGSGVLVTKLTYIFDEETPRWRNLLSELGL